MCSMVLLVKIDIMIVILFHKLLPFREGAANAKNGSV